MQPARLVIFDCDGVLVDSEQISIEVLVGFLTEAGLAIDEETAYRHFLGRSMTATAGMLQEDFGYSIGAEAMADLRATLYARFRRDLKPMPGVRDALGRIDMPVCVASSSQPERIEVALRLTGLLECFASHIYSSSMVESGKPAPDLFLYAARCMGIDPAACVVVEDSLAGIEAAKRAEMSVFAFVGGAHAGPSGLRALATSLDPDVVFDDMTELPGLLAGFGAKKKAL